MLIPEEYDGLGLDTLTYLVALEEIATVDASVAVMMSVHNSLPTQMLLRWGTEEQKERFLKPMARGEMLGAFALSEPEAGSDAASLRTQAVRDGDDWVLNGTKAWVSSGTKARRHPRHGAHRLARRPPRRARHQRVHHHAGPARASSVGKKEDKMGLRASPTVQLIFDDMRVPAANLLGDAGQGFIYAMQSLDNGRLGIAAQAIGIAEAALDTSVGVRGRAEAVRQADQGIPGDPVQARRHGDARRRGARAAALPRPRRRIAASRSRSSARWPSCSRARRRCG